MKLVKSYALLPVFLLTVCAAAGIRGAEIKRPKSDVGSFAGTAVTTSQTAVFASFLSNQGPSESLPSGINTAISISNILAVPPGFSSDNTALGDPMVNDDTGQSRYTSGIRTVRVISTESAATALLESASTGMERSPPARRGGYCWRRPAVRGG